MNANTTGDTAQQAVLDDPDTLRFARQIALPEWGQDGQEKLARSRVTVVGLGGLGCPVAATLANAGIGALTLIDFDRVDLSNLPRQTLYTDADVGKPKSTVAASALGAMAPNLAIMTHDSRLDDAALRATLADCDVLVDCTDNLATRFQLNAAAWDTRTPLVSGAAVRFDAQLAVFRLDRGAGPCYRCLHAEDDDGIGDCSGHGVFTPLVTMTGAMQAAETLKILLDVGADSSGRLYCFDNLDNRWREVALNARPDCAVCG